MYVDSFVATVDEEDFWSVESSFFVRRLTAYIIRDNGDGPPPTLGGLRGKSELRDVHPHAMMGAWYVCRSTVKSASSSVDPCASTVLLLKSVKRL